MRCGVQITMTAVLLVLIAQPSPAERNFIPSIERAFDVCPDRPSEPEWMQDIPLRDAFQRVLVQDIYRAQNMERIVETGECACDTRFPAWDGVEGAFRENYATATRWEMLDASETYNRRANNFRLEAKAICEAAGNW